MSLQPAPALFRPLPPWPFAELRPHAYNLIVYDGPVEFETYSPDGQEKGPGAQYECLPVEEVFSRWPPGDLAEPTCLLLCWGTWPLMDRLLTAVKGGGFDFKSVIVWQKVFASGKPAIGTGYRVRSMCEPVIVATRGEPRHKPFPGLFAGVRREHSRKPEEFYGLVNRCCPRLARRADVFARQRRPGWDAFGNEVGKFSEVSA